MESSRESRDERGPLTYLLRILRFFFHSAATIATRHIANPYHLIHIHSVPDFLVFAGLIPKLSGVPVILDIHDILARILFQQVQCTSRFACLQTLAAG